MLTNGAVFLFHGACSIAFILANCQNTIKETKEPETHFPALYQAILCIVEFGTVLKNCEFASAKSWRFCLQRDVPYFRTLSLPQPAFCQKWVLSNTFSCCQHLVPAFHTPSFRSSPWDLDSCVVENGEVWGSTHTELCASCPRTLLPWDCLPEGCLGWEVCSFPTSPKPKTPATPECNVSVRCISQSVQL